MIVNERIDPSEYQRPTNKLQTYLYKLVTMSYFEIGIFAIIMINCLIIALDAHDIS